MSEPLVTIIVPVYNAGVHLGRCLDSLTGQTLKEIEIILVLDCPTDGSDKVAEEYAGRDSRIRIIRNERNMHIGNSRNEGLQAARGKYIGFSDHDDYMEPEMFETLYHKAEEDSLDLVCSPHVCILGEERICVDDFPEGTPEELTGKLTECTIGADSYDYSRVFTLGSVWNKLYRADVIRKHRICFVDTRIVTAEDVCFVLDYACCIRRTGCVSVPLYYHVLDIGNTGAALSYNTMEKMMDFMDYMQVRLKRAGIFAIYRRRWENTVRLKLYNALYRDYKVNGLSSVFRNIRKIRRRTELKKAFRGGPTVFMERKNPVGRMKFIMVKTLIML